MYKKDELRLKFNINDEGLKKVGVLMDVVVWRLGRGLDLYEETNTRNVRKGRRDEIKKKMKR
jgi:hypothetical protein